MYGVVPYQLKGFQMKRLIASILATISITVSAADITGAGATFPYPIYAKWAEA